MNTIRKFALVALCASALTAVSQTSQADVLFDITNGAAVPAFSYGSAVGSNNVINAAGAPATGSTVTDPTGGSTSEWLGTASGGPSSFISVTGLSAGQNYSINWTYIGSESGDVVQLTIPGLGTTPFNETNINNNLAPPAGCCSGPNPVPTVNLLSTFYTENGVNIPVFTLKDLTTLGTVTNGGANAAPNTNVASLIFAYATFSGGLYTLTDTPTDFIVFGFNDNGFADDNHDDFMGVMTLVPGGTQETPIPGALPLFGSVLGGGFLFRRLRKRRQARAA
jgi:hypothetical protein